MNNSEQNEQISAYGCLQPIYQKAIDLRLNGHRHTSIANILSQTGHKVTEHTVRVWFSKGGKCCDIYNSIKQERMIELTEALKENDFQIKAAVVESLAIIRTVLDQALCSEEITPFHIKVAQDVLDRGGVPKQTRVDSNTYLDIGKRETLDNMASNIKRILSPAG